MLRSVAHEAEDGQWGAWHRSVGTFDTIAGLLGQLAEVDRATIQTGRCAGFQPPLRQLQLLQPSREGDGRRVTRAPGAVALQPDMNLAVEKGACRQDHGARPEANAHLRDGTCNSVSFENQVIAGALKQPQVRVVLDALADRCLVENAIGLRPRRAHGGALRAVQDAKLDAGFVGCRGHHAAERVDLLHQMPLADPADRRVATHLAERLDVVRQQQCRRAHACGGERGFGAGMAATDHDHVEFLREQHRHA